MATGRWTSRPSSAPGKVISGSSFGGAMAARRRTSLSHVRATCCGLQMPPSAARCVNPRAWLVLVLLALSGEAFAQADERDAVIDELRRRIEALEKRLEEKPAPSAPQPPPAAQPPAPGAQPAAAPKPGASERAGNEDQNARALERSLVREGGLRSAEHTSELQSHSF